MMRIALLSLLLSSPAAALELPAPTLAELTVTPGLQTTWLGGSFVQVEQRLADLPVHGTRLRAEYDPRGELRALHGDLLDMGPFSLQPTVPRADAIASAVAAVQAELGTGELWPPRAELGVLARRGTHLVWVVEVGTVQPLGHQQVFVDAHDGSLHAVRPRLFTALGNVYPTNPEVSDVATVELNDVTNFLVNDYARVASCSDWSDEDTRCYAKESQAVVGADGNFLYDPNPLSETDDPFAEVHMFHHLDLIARWFEDRFGFRTDFGPAGRAVEGIVNFGYANAFFGDGDGDGIPEVSFGQSGAADFAYDADVVYHEFTHAVFGQIVETGFGRFDEWGRDVGAGGLNEGTADLFAMILTGDPLIGEYAAGNLWNGPEAIRDLEDDRRCPDHVYGETHHDGEIWGSFGWNLIDHPAIGPDLTADLIFGAISSWPSEVNWGVAGRSVVETAETLVADGAMTNEQLDVVRELAEAQGLDDCGRVVRLDDGAEPTQAMRGGFRQDGEVFAMPLANQFSLDAPAGTVALTFDVVGLEGTPGLGYTLHVRRGEHIVHDLVPFGNNGWEVAVPADFDFTVEGSDVGTVLELDAMSDPPLEPGATYFFSIAPRPEATLQGFGFADITVAGSAEIVPVEEAPLGDDDDLEGGDGCSSGCAALPGAGFLAPLMLFGLRRRRRS